MVCYWLRTVISRGISSAIDSGSTPRSVGNTASVHRVYGAYLKIMLAMVSSYFFGVLDMGRDAEICVALFVRDAVFGSWVRHGMSCVELDRDAVEGFIDGLLGKTPLRNDLAMKILAETIKTLIEKTSWIRKQNEAFIHG